MTAAGDDVFLDVDVPADHPSRGGRQVIPRPFGVRAGHDAPWDALPASGRDLSLDEIRANLESSPDAAPSPLEAVTGRASAVLAPLYEHDGAVWVVLTRRAWHLRSHKGEVSFPGGGQEDGETLWETALRESQEETGLDPDSVEYLGELDHLSTFNRRAYIVPFVGLLPGRPHLRRNPNEVEAIVHVRLSELLLAGVYRQERWGVPGIDRPIHYFELVGDTVWGATGSMLVELLCRAAGVYQPR